MLSVPDHEQAEAASPQVCVVTPPLLDMTLSPVQFYHQSDTLLTSTQCRARINAISLLRQ